MKPFREALADIMAIKGLEQLELAVTTDVSQSAISLYLAGKRVPRPSTIAKLATGLDVSPEYFIEYRRWRLHRLLDEWIEEDEDQVELLLARADARRDLSR